MMQLLDIDITPDCVDHVELSLLQYHYLPYASVGEGK